MAYLKLFCDSLEKYRKLDDAEFGRLIRAALIYKETGEETELPGREDLLWDSLRLEIDRDNEKYADVSGVKSEAGKKGAAARWNKDGAESTKVPVDGRECQKNSRTMAGDGKMASAICHMAKMALEEEEEKDKDKDKDKDEEEDKDEDFSQREREKEREKAAPAESSGFVTPTQAEVAEYCRERGNDIDPERFIAVNAAKGWRIGNTPIADWKALIPAWEKTQFKKSNREADESPPGAYGNVTAAHMANIAKMRDKIARQNESGP